MDPAQLSILSLITPMHFTLHNLSVIFDYQIKIFIIDEITLIFKCLNLFKGLNIYHKTNIKCDNYLIISKVGSYIASLK